VRSDKANSRTISNLFTTRGDVDFSVLFVPCFSRPTHAFDSNSLATFHSSPKRVSSGLDYLPFFRLLALSLEVHFARKNSYRNREDGVHSPVAASKAEGVQVLWYVLRLTGICLHKAYFVQYRTDTKLAVDHSLLSRYVLKPYWWSQVINLFPMSMAPNAVSCCSAVCDWSSGYGVLIMSSDYSLWIWLRDLERRDYALLFSGYGPGLPCLGLLVVGYWSLLVSDF